ncbi:MAG: hypothetical protein ACRC4N_05755, partial [Gammaproteobacteria bacterium]
SKYNTALVEGCCDVLQALNVKSLGSTIGQTFVLINNGIREQNDPIYFFLGDPDERGYCFIYRL